MRRSRPSRSTLRRTARSSRCRPSSVSGTAADDSGVASIETAVQHTATGNWWTGSAWSPTEKWFAVTPASVGAASTAWSWTWSPPAAGGYTIRARSVDLVGNRSDVSSAGITVDIGGPDTVAPNGTVSGLVNNQTLPLGPITFGGLGDRQRRSRRRAGRHPEPHDAPLVEGDDRAPG